MNPDCYHHFHNEEDYYYMAMRNYEITDAEAISLLCEAAKLSITNEPYDEIVEGLRLHFTGGVLLKERNINITETDFHKLMEILAKDPAEDRGNTLCPLLISAERNDDHDRKTAF